MKRFLILFALFATIAQAQTSVQLFYDFGSTGTACANQRDQQITATIEHLSFDGFGSNFFFVDLDFKGQHNSPLGAYIEYSRTLNFWQNTKARDLSLHIEYNGGAVIGYGISHSVLGGIEYQIHSQDFAHFITFQALARYTKGVRVPVQLTAVWGTKICNGLTFSGYADFYEDGGAFAFSSEPQIWYNVGKWMKMDNLFVGTEIELSYNFAGRGFMCNPCLGIKWKL